MRNFLCLFLSFGFIVFTTGQTFAATVEINGVPTTIDKDSEFEVTVNISHAAANTSNYLRAAFFTQSSPTSYFGFTQNQNSEWYNGTPSPIDPHKFLQIQINEEGSWSGKLKTKVDLQSSYFKGGGNYSFKIGRYTASGSSVTDWSNESQLLVNAPLPTPTPFPTAVPTKVPTLIPTSKPSPTKIPTQIPTSKPTLTKSSSSLPLIITPTKSFISNIQIPTSSVATISGVLGASTNSARLTMLSPEKVQPKKKPAKARVLGISSQAPNILFFLGGGIFITLCGILGFRKWRKHYG